MKWESLKDLMKLLVTWGRKSHVVFKRTEFAPCFVGFCLLRPEICQVYGGLFSLLIANKERNSKVVAEVLQGSFGL